MAFLPRLFQRSVVRQQTNPFEVNWASSLSRGLVRLLVPTGESLLDLVTRQAYATTGAGAVSLVANTEGVGVSTVSSSRSFVIPLRTEARDSFSMGRIGDVQGGTTICVRDNTATGGTILFWRNSGWDARVGGKDFTAAGTWDLSKLYRAVYVSSATAVSIHVGGQGKVLSGGAPGATALNTQWFLHKNGTSAQWADAVTNMLAIWDRPLSDDEAKQWTDNPYELLSSDRSFVFYEPPVGGGAPTLSDIKAANITATTVQGTYDYVF